MEPEFFVDNVNLSERNSSMTFINFTDKIMASIYKLIFGTTLPRITEEMKAYLQNSNEPVGDWYIVLRVYGFEEEPYILSVFLQKEIFLYFYNTRRLPT